MFKAALFLGAIVLVSQVATGLGAAELVGDVSDLSEQRHQAIEAATSN